jgi:hypothetical protein
MQTLTDSFPVETQEHDASVVTGPPWVHVVVISVIAIALTYPCIRRGLPLGHSTITHILYQHFFNEQIAQGDWYPRWIISMNRGLGGGAFVAQYPLPYYVAWSIGKIIPNHWGSYEETRTLGLSLAFATILAGLFAYAWCATFVDRLTAMLAAIIYLTLPYFLTIDLYLRAAIGEFWALSFLPLSLYFIERMTAGSRRALPGLAVAFALVIVSHLFTAVLLAPVLLAYAVWRVARGQRMLVACQVLAAFLLATGLAGAYALPFLAQRGFLHPENFLLTQGANASPLSQMFSFNAFTFPGTWGRPGVLHLVVAARLIALVTAAFIGVVWFRSRRERLDWVHLVAGVIAIAALVRAALAGRHVLPTGVPGALLLSPYLIEQRADIFLYSFLTFETALVCYWTIRNCRHNRLADFLMVLALASYVMMTSWSLIVWRSVHFLWNIQFPWRLNTFLLAATAGLAALAISGLRTVPTRRGLVGALVALGLWGVVAVASARMGNTFSAFRSAESYPFRDGMDSAREIYMQVDPKQALLVKPPDNGKVYVTVERGSGVAAVTSVLPRSIQIEARCETDCTLQVGQFYYPAWRVRTVPAATVRLYAGSPGGLMEFALHAGEYHLVLEVPYGLSERLGAWLSLACLLVVMIIAIRGTPLLQIEPAAP